MLYALVDSGYLEKTPGKYPVLKRTQKASRPLEREASLKADWPELKAIAGRFGKKDGG